MPAAAACCTRQHMANYAFDSNRSERGLGTAREGDQDSGAPQAQCGDERHERRNKRQEELDGVLRQQRRGDGGAGDGEEVPRHSARRAQRAHERGVDRERGEHKRRRR